MKGFEHELKAKDKIVVIIDAAKDVQYINQLARDLDPLAFKFGHGLLRTKRPSAIINMLKTHNIQSWLDTAFTLDADQMTHEIEASLNQGFDLTTISPLAGVRSMQAAAKATNYNQKTAVIMPNYDDDLIPRFVANIDEANNGLSHQDQITDIICNVGTLKTIKSMGDFTLTATGIHYDAKQTHDHPVVMTPKQALEEGADRLAIGRLITERLDNATKTFEAIVEDVRDFTGLN